MKIGELAKRSGQTQSRIRFYERIGLLKLVDRRSNGYRTYPPEALVVLNLIDTAQSAGFTLDEIRQMVPSDLDEWKHDGLLDALRAKVAEIAALEAKLKNSKAQIKRLIAEIEAKPDDMDCKDNARRIMANMLVETTR
ncbi:transcriptional regulator, MerR family [Roseovarius pacificus]|uniref:Transcriptional regulator, MerR family n=1 Tax=Roseovarius pacificus TaxID=337701 RepID=A0A1M7HFQ7_9RHOB|nr:MerR family transcriptional regulator [Roseovarius pacificus]GGO58448.1 transcriptional regulator [Roseovarius pacificus]SHM27371.1 transcriptional regulator, MerR family [Roseovarius pacificus]